MGKPRRWSGILFELRPLRLEITKNTAVFAAICLFCIDFTKIYAKTQENDSDSRYTRRNTIVSAGILKKFEENWKNALHIYIYI